MTDYAIWKPEHDGHAPPNWRDEMQRYYSTDGGKVLYRVTPHSAFDIWYQDNIYFVPAEALNSPNDDASGDVDAWAESDAKRILRLVESLRAYPAETLAKHGITLAPEKDWARELAIDFLAAGGWKNSAARFFEGDETLEERAAIELLRTRFEQMIAERSKRDA